MKIVILGGFLGSGKTSVLMGLAKDLASQSQEGAPKVVVIENEIGEVGVDDKLLKTGGYQVKNMFSGCVCCSMAGDIIKSLTTIQNDFNPELVIIESSGVGYPSNIKENIEHTMNIPCKIVCIIDAKRWLRILKPMGPMLHDQLVDSDYFLINKVDLVDEETVNKTRESVHEFEPKGKLFNICAIKGLEKSLVDEILA